LRRPWLAPLTPIYAAGLAMREMRLKRGWETVKRLPLPVVSIGNLSTGGSGKTPLAIALAKALTERGWAVDVLSRGYGRDSSHPARVDPEGAAEQFGDEPLLIAREAQVPVYVAAQRYEAGLLAEAAQPEATRLAVHLLDDGFQHRQLQRDVDVLLVNRDDWHDCLLPGGNLREPLKAARRATVIAIPADDPTLAVPSVAGPVVAFCGIARPEQFFSGLEAAGLHLAARVAFADHHRYTQADIERLMATSHDKAAAGLITTEKDQVRLGKLAPAFPESMPLKTASLTIDIENRDDALDWLVARVAEVSPA